MDSRAYISNQDRLPNRSHVNQSPYTELIAVGIMQVLNALKSAT